MEKSIQVVTSEKHVIRFTAEDVMEAIREKVKRMDNRMYRYKQVNVDVEVTRGGILDGATVTIDVEDIATSSAAEANEQARKKQRKLDLERCEPHINGEG